MKDDIDTIMRRCDELGTISEEADRLTRRFATAALREAQGLVASWMHAAGMLVEQDAIGNLCGHYAAERPNAPVLLLGSHLDSVRDAGKYDGPLGVLLAIAAVGRLAAADRRLPFAIEVYAFADEEGLRYPTAYLGSSTLAGSFDSAWLDLLDADEIPLREVLRVFGGDPDAIESCRRDPAQLLGYCEVHIEQGPVLEANKLPVGIVTAIAGQSRLKVRFSGIAGHAGTVPMALRRDALCAAAEFVLAAEALAQATPGLVATIGQINAAPGASNVIPGQAVLSLDVRHQNDSAREDALVTLQLQAERIAAARDCQLDWQRQNSYAATPCDAHLSRILASSVGRLGYPAFALPSGAGHDAVALSAITPTAMLFVRCEGGISHNPAEAVAADDVGVALDVLEVFIELLAELY
jgi:allantoate deiminase